MELFRQNLPKVNCKIRFIHAVPNAPNIDVYSNGNLLVSNLSFSSISQYLIVSPDTYEIQIYKSGLYDSPLLTQNVQLSPGSNYTISVVTLNDTLFLFKLRDAGIPSSLTSSYLRFINLSPNAPLLSLELPNDVELFNNVEYLETTGYYTISSGIYNLKVSFSNSDVGSKYIKNTNFQNGKLYTIYVIGLFNDKPPLGYLLLEDEKN